MMKNLLNSFRFYFLLSICLQPLSVHSFGLLEATNDKPEARLNKDFLNRGKKVSLSWEKLPENFKQVYRNMYTTGNTQNIPPDYLAAILLEKTPTPSTTPPTAPSTTTPSAVETAPQSTTVPLSQVRYNPPALRAKPSTDLSYYLKHLATPEEVEFNARLNGFFPCEHTPHTFRCGLSYCSGGILKYFTFKPKDIHEETAKGIYDFDTYIKMNPNSYEEKKCRVPASYKEYYYNPANLSGFIFSGIIKVKIYFNGSNKIAAIPFITNRLTPVREMQDGSNEINYRATFFEVIDFNRFNNLKTYVSRSNTKHLFGRWNHAKYDYPEGLVESDKTGSYDHLQSLGINLYEITDYSYKIFNSRRHSKYGDSWYDNQSIRRFFGGPLSLTLTPVDNYFFNAIISSTALLTLSESKKVKQPIRFSTRTPIVISPKNYSTRKDASKLEGEHVLISDTFHNKKRRYVAANKEQLPDFEPFEIRMYVAQAVGKPDGGGYEKEKANLRMVMEKHFSNP